MAWTGDSMATVQELMLERPLDDLILMAYRKNALYNRVRRTSRKEDFWGKYARLQLHTSMPMVGGPRPELSDVSLPGPDSFDTAYLYVKQYMFPIGWTEEEAEEVIQKNDAATVNLVNLKMKNAFMVAQFIYNTLYQGDGTGRLARVSAWDDGAQKVTVDNTDASFGWSKCAHIEDGMLVDIYTLPASAAVFTDAWTLKVSGATVSSVNKTAGTFVVSGHTVNPADNDFVFLHQSVSLKKVADGGTLNAWKQWENTPGMMAIVDDGSSNDNEFHNGTVTGANGSWYGKTFQTIDRTLTALMRSSILRAGDWGGGTDGTVTTGDLSVVDNAIMAVDEEGLGGGEITCLQMNGRTRNWMRDMAAASGNAFMPIQSGKLVPGLYIESYRTSTGKIVDIVPMPSMPDGYISGVNENDLILFEPIPIGWHKVLGNIIFPSPGTRNLTNEAWLRGKQLLAAKRCDNCFQIQDIDISH